MLTSFKAKAAAFALPVLAAGGIAFTAALPANATTLTCTNVANATTSPFGCGGLQSDSTTNGTLDLAHVTNVYNAPVTVQADSSTTSEDWTAFAVKIGSAPYTTGGVGGLGEYVAMDTPNGQIPRFTIDTPSTAVGCTTDNTTGTTYTNAEPCAGAVFTAGADDYCLSVEHATINNKYRWWSVLRECNSNGTFTYGTPTEPGFVTTGIGNAYQEWAPINSSASGFLMDNVWLRDHSNVDYDLNITANGGAGTMTQAWPETGVAALWEQWGIIGCTPPANLLSVQTYVNCP